MPANYSNIGSEIGLLGGPVGAGIGGLVGAGLDLITGSHQKKEGRKLINQPYPEETIPTEITDAAAQGLPPQQYQQAMKNIARQQSAAIQQAQDRRSGIGLIGQTQLQSNNAAANLDAANAAARISNLKTLGLWKDKVWQHNVKDKYNRDYNYGMSLLGAGNQNFTSGIDRFGAGLGLIAGGSGMFNRSNGGSGTGSNYAAQVAEQNAENTRGFSY